MAFKILTEDQLELLTEEQRVRYEEELSIYQQRVEFVRKLEQYEDIELPTVKAVRTPIQMVAPIDVPQIKFQENTITVPQAAIHQEAPKLPGKLDGPVSIREVPQVAIPTAAVAEIKFESIQPVVPQVGIPAVQEYSYEAPAAVSVSVPELTQVQAPVLETKPIAPAKVSIPTVANVELPDVSGVQEALKQPVLSELPKVAVAAVETPMPVMPEAAAAVPTVAVAAPTPIAPITMPETGEIRVPHTALPEQPAAPKITMPTLAEPELPVLQQPAAVSCEVHVEAPVLTELPKLAEVRLPRIPAAPEAAAAIWKELPRVEIPQVPTAAQKAADMVRRVEAQPAAAVTAPKIPTVAVKEIHLPERPDVAVPKVTAKAPVIDEQLLADLMKQIQRGE